MNERLFQEMTGRKPRTAAQNAAHYAKEDEAFKVRLAGLPVAEAKAVCLRYLAVEGRADTLSGRTAAAYLTTCSA